MKDAPAGHPQRRDLSRPYSLFGRMIGLLLIFSVVIPFVGVIFPDEVIGQDRSSRDEPVDSPGHPGADAQPTPAMSSFSIKDIDKLQKIVEKLRRLKFKNKVKSSIKTKEALRKKLMDDFDEEASEIEMEKIRKALMKFGLISKDLKLRRLMINLLTEQIAGFYDPKTKELSLIKVGQDKNVSAESIMIERMFGVSLQNVITIHELTHALQDQHFDLLSLPLDSSDNDDLATALRSLVEGEATFIQYAYLFEKRGLDLALMPGITKQAKIQGYTGMEMMDRAPAYIKEGLLFPYLEGFAFVLTVKRQKGWAGVSRMYQHLPSSTEQILHPEKYLADSPDYPTTIQLPDLTKILLESSESVSVTDGTILKKQPARHSDSSEQNVGTEPKPEAKPSLDISVGTGEWAELLKNVMGELNIRILFQEFLPTLKPRKIASGWDGDQFIVLENSRTQDMMLIWFTFWDTVKDAKEFFEAYGRLITQKYPEAHMAKQSEGKILWSMGENLILIEQRDHNVLVIETAPEKILAELSEIIWQNTKMDELKEVKRVEKDTK